MSVIPNDISEIIEKCLNESIESFEVSVHGGNKKGEGFIGEIVFMSLKNKETGKEEHLVVKKVFPSDKESTTNFLSNSYLNEIHFYNELWPDLKEFQKSFSKATAFEIAAKCYATSSERGQEKVVLENLKFKNYEVHPKKEPLSEELYEAIFKLYGQYHALSFAFKHYQPEDFSQLAKPLSNNWLGFKDTELFAEGVKVTFEIIKRMFENSGEEEILKKIQPYYDNCHKMFEDAVQYSGPYSVIIHGDCWSNNLMIKYNDSKQIEDIKLIDYQMCMVGTPVYDLTYSLYSGASKDTLRNWEKLLNIYYKSLGKSLKEYNLDVENIYTFEELKQEWKNYSQFGFIMSLLIWGAKFVEEDEVQNLDVTEKKNDRDMKILMNKEFTTSLYNLVKYCYENDML